ncbi:Xaa-Pro dipeptidase [Wickerhamomyces ciferrii]|uniref:Xaa-Pro dipeptidase n=1 Tax=Wickerhamomyces ciferrii (strain ATCC 14091 / BCRC 22168 / CBS 111 / JCM 3599 / NBRC 0793 / NRRL Y-1031 F-60-10) TaxID=1206466 RepID=K0KSD0_WICCF|nr:Xaa-Pro dipeptidase [Wickerhamomyces ciferrii]CCH44238.1 Xaa-Pro dipeptidase [Wickerhamomyces ciferrii]
MTIPQRYPARQHALNVKHHLQTKLSDLSKTSIFLSGSLQESDKYSDSSKPFKQERYFFYLTGVNIPGSHVFYDLNKEELVLFLPEIDQDDVMWSGLPLSIEDASKKFDVDKVVYSNEIPNYLSKYDVNLTTDIDKNNQIYKNQLTPGQTELFYALDESRIIKDSYEIELLRKAAKITDNCHYAVMSALPIETNETHIHAEFMYHAIRQGSKHTAYDPICCSGPSCGTLHYVKNDDDLGTKQSILIDAGAEWENYAADVTRSFPINGEWSKEHREIYDSVKEMQDKTLELIKPGQSWDELHLLAHKVLIERFLKLGIFHNGTKEEIYESGASTIFFPHGLGHLLGMDTHDVGGHPNYEDPDEKLQYLRLRRTLQKGYVVTDEPGIYFSPFLVENGFKDVNKRKYVNEEIMKKYYPIGGVRIEDDILVTEDGYENLTGITSDADEISKIVKAGIAKGRSYFHNVV